MIGFLTQFFLEKITFETDDVSELEGMSPEEIEEYITENMWDMDLPESADNVYHGGETLGEALSRQSEYKERYLDLHPNMDFPTEEYPKSGYSIMIEDED